MFTQYGVLTSAGGGDGADAIDVYLGPGGEDVVCGEGEDLVAGPESGTRVGFDCELITREYSPFLQYHGIRLRRQPVSFLE